MKKLILLILSLSIILSLCACGTGDITAMDESAETEREEEIPETENDEILESGSCGVELTWELSSSGTLTISGTGEMDDYSNYSAPWNEMTEQRDQITSIIIEEGVSSVGDSAFYGMSSVEDVTMADTVVTIGSYSFCRNGLSSIQMSRNLAFIYNEAFSDCDNLTDLVIPNSVAKIYNKAFYGCDTLTKVYLGKNLKAIGEDAFKYCNVETYYFGGSEDDWESIEITGNDNPKNPECNYEIEDSEPSVKIDNFLMEDNAASTVLGNNNVYRNDILHIYFLNTLDNVPQYAWDVSKYMNYSIMAWIEDADDSYYDLYIAADGKIQACSCDGLFANYTELEAIDFNDCFCTENAKSMNSMFEKCQTITTLDLSCFDTSNVTEMSAMFRYCNELEKVDISSFDTFNVRKMDYVFAYCTCLYSVNLSNFSMENIQTIENMFFHCYALADIAIPNTLTEISESAFTSCKSLTTITIPDSVTAIQGDAFSFCDNLINISIPISVTEIGQYAFSNCESLTDIYYSGSESDWNAISIASANSKLSEVTIHYNND